MVKTLKYGRCLFIVVEYYHVCNSSAFPIEGSNNDEYLNWGECINCQQTSTYEEEFEKSVPRKSIRVLCSFSMSFSIVVYQRCQWICNFKKEKKAYQIKPLVLFHEWLKVYLFTCHQIKRVCARCDAYFAVSLVRMLGNTL